MARDTARGPEIDEAVVSAFRRGDEDAFAQISRQHFRELHVHCYRMLGSFDEAEDLVQETLLRAWRNRDRYEGRASIRAWLYRIATNACIDAMRRRTPRSTEAEDSGALTVDAGAPPYTRFPWMQPYPDRLLDTVESVATSDRPDARLVTRETIELAFLAAIQRLPAKQRAVLILRDVLEFSAADTAEVLDDTPAAVNSALQRARETVRRQHGRSGAAPSSTAPAPTFGEAVFLQAYVDASERGDVDTIVSLLKEDVHMTLFPDGVTWNGRDAVTCRMHERKDEFGDVRSIAIAANRQPAVAVYRRLGEDADYRAWAIVLLGVADGQLQEIATFASPELFSRFDLPPTLSDRDR